MKKQAGVTLLEIMIALAIIAVALALVMPNANQMVSRFRFESQAFDFFISLSLARDEAIKRKMDVTLCPSENGATCAAPGDWNRGWIIKDASGNLIKVHQALAGTTTIVAEAGSSYDTSITYELSGRASAAGNLVLCYVDSHTGIMNLLSGRTVMVGTTGAATMDKNADHHGVITTMFADCDGNI